jgi:ATP-dependent exoDNAse (exonuclease V) alpha subunit
MTLRYALLSLVLFVPALNAMHHNPNAIKVHCDIAKTVHTGTGLSFISFSGSFLPTQHDDLIIDNTVALQLSVTQRPTITINSLANAITIKCAFKAAGARQSIAINETILLANQSTQTDLPEDWRMTTTITIPADDCDR